MISFCVRSTDGAARMLTAELQPDGAIGVYFGLIEVKKPSHAILAAAALALQASTTQECEVIDLNDRR